jgi:hypothetical protein
MEYPVEQVHPFSAFAAQTAATEQQGPGLPFGIYDTGLCMYDGDIDILPGTVYQFHEGYHADEFDPATHPGLIERYRRIDLETGLGREILIGVQDPNTGLWDITVRDLDIILVQSVAEPFHFPQKHYHHRFWGEAHIAGGNDGYTIILVPESP